ncbi:hypothetical protein [Rhodobacter maris]|uniref:Uncharacterized protein n=1 Tax=Rhodobacter maris TaxID=446682 RepID=A0A285SV76_9RHOB|nr:hypothetical protein [Rhodobacter maris]SOC12487.1 hypothetical protein SAMN05877831_11011 [Rhodobacter maris]
MFQPMPLPHFLLMLLVVILAAALTIVVAVHAAVPLAALGLAALIGAALMRLFERVE